MNSRPSRQEAEALLRALTRALASVAVLAAVFTAVNVTGFATTHKIPPLTAALLDPMVVLALATVLLADARLASWGVPPPGWSAALRWFTGCTATVMNTWTSIWPDDRIGWPRHADPTGVLLHTVPPVLLILLTETVAAYRHRITTPPLPPHDHPQEHPAPAPLPPSTVSPTATPDTIPPGPPPLPHPHPHPHPHPGTTALHPVHVGPCTAGRGPQPAGTALPGQPSPTHRGDPAHGGVFARALRLDAEHRSRTGRPMSIRQLKRALRIGHPRAKSLRTQLETRTATATHHPLPGPLPGARSTHGSAPQTRS
ncbi:hypothetical protein [Streptantibioticus ferralitis]|uniref:DUF2637 domain-containing protein n=1 Tax=Streptantibioticus ferralitis TaxID=236510 RepID=A0ABT5Z1H9_9ACTN|nr:hypothetical protein [Streptantibioticus ferralitis]MDF2257693.1 hypothetical protein [Streptantibioticus ferralitis]